MNSTDLIINNIVTDEKGNGVYNIDTATDETTQETHYMLTNLMEEEQLKYFTAQLKVPHSRIISRPKPENQNEYNPSSERQLKLLIGQMRELNKQKSVENLLYNSSPRDHWYGIQLKMNSKSYIIAKIADSLCPNYETNAQANAERQELLNAIKTHNKTIWNSRSQMSDVAQKRNAYASATDKKNFTFTDKNGTQEKYRQIKADDAVQTVTVRRQTITNSCGLHTAVNLFALNQNPKSKNITCFGQGMEDGIKNMKNVNLSVLAQQIQYSTKTVPSLQM